MENAILVTVDLGSEKESWPVEARALELKELAISSGADVQGELICHRQKPTPDLFIGKGKSEELALLCEAKDADIVIFNNDLTPTQLRNLEKLFHNDIRVIDRTQLILDIFSKRAKSMEGKLQVELAQIEYLLPRLTGKGIYLSRLGGGIGTRGPGEKNLEYDRRRIKIRIGRLKLELEDMGKRREALRQHRKDSMITTIAIVGYTNAGKTTLLNALTNSDKLTKDQLFTTLDTVTRGYVLPNNLKVVFQDTVGFLYKLPHHLVESFKATLEEVRMADIIVHVIDAGNHMVDELINVVHSVLKELGAENKRTINAFNKIDLVENISCLRRFERELENVVQISALKRIGIEGLIDKILSILSKSIVKINVEIPHTDMDKLHLIYENGKVNYREDRLNSIYIEAEVPVRLKDLIASA